MTQTLGRIGPRMQDAIWTAEQFPGLLKTRLSRLVHHAISTQHYGINTVNRALKLGLLRVGTCQEADCKAPSEAHCHIWAV